MEVTLASYKEFKNGHCRVLIRRKAVGTICKTFDSRDEAQAWAEAEEAQLMQRVFKAATAPAGGITLREAWQGYLDSVNFEKKAASTRRREKQAAVALLRHMGGLSLAAIDRVRAQHFIDKRRKEKNIHGERLAGDTIHRERELLSAIFKWAIRRGYATINPARFDLDMPTCGIREARITVEQEAALYDAAWEFIDYKGRGHPPNPCLFPWFQFVFGTGTRPGEAAKIELDWVHLKEHEVHIPRAGHKTRRPRIILLAPAIAKMVELQYGYAEKEGSKYLFFSRGKKSFKPYSYAKPWKAICKRAGIPPAVVAHSMRHEFISRMFERTEMSDSQVAMLVGDVHPLSLRPYTHLRANILRPKLAEFEKAISSVKGAYYEQKNAKEKQHAAEKEAAALLRKLASSK